MKIIIRHELEVNGFLDPGTLARDHTFANEKTAIRPRIEALHHREGAAPGAPPLAGIERHAFYAAARGAFAVVQCLDPRPYGCFLVRKGVIAG